MAGPSFTDAELVAYWRTASAEHPHRLCDPNIARALLRTIDDLERQLANARQHIERANAQAAFDRRTDDLKLAHLQDTIAVLGCELDQLRPATARHGGL